MRKYLILVLGVVIFWNAGILFAQDYLVGEEDVLKITVYDHPDLTTLARVSGDGFVKLPLISAIKVSGLTTSQIAQKIIDLLADGYIVDPHVSVFVEEFKSRKIIIMGQVSKPGIYSLSGNTSFLELLSRAGGVTKEAGDKAVIKRKIDKPVKQESIITIDLKKLLEEGDTASDVLLMDNDNIYIAKAGVFYITGEVRKPDAYKFEEGTTVIKAATMAGGFTDKASQGRIKIIRKIDGKEKVIEKAELDEPILPGDVVVVPESFF